MLAAGVHVAYLVLPQLRDLALDDTVRRLAQVAARSQDGFRRDGSLVLGQAVVGILQQRPQFEMLVEIERQAAAPAPHSAPDPCPRPIQPGRRSGR
jgi:hypothetical protein